MCVIANGFWILHWTMPPVAGCSNIFGMSFLDKILFIARQSISVGVISLADVSAPHEDLWVQPALPKSTQTTHCGETSSMML